MGSGPQGRGPGRPAADHRPEVRPRRAGDRRAARRRPAAAPAAGRPPRPAAARRARERADASRRSTPSSPPSPEPAEAAGRHAAAARPARRLRSCRSSRATTPPVYIETFNADNLFEKIDGRAESFIQNGVKGMACCSYHPPGNEDDEVQLFIFEMGDPLKARGKYDSEKPDEAKPLASVGEGGLHGGRQRVLPLRPLLHDRERRSGRPEAGGVRPRTGQEGRRAPEDGPRARGPSPRGRCSPSCPPSRRRSGMKYVAQDVFGYSFLSDVFLADYEVGDVKFQGFLRPYATAEEAQEDLRQLRRDRQEGRGRDQGDRRARRPIRWSSAPTSACSTWSSSRGTPCGGSNGATDAEAGRGVRQGVRRVAAGERAVRPRRRSRPPRTRKTREEEKH